MSLDLKTTFKSIALAGLVATAPMVANDAKAGDKSAHVGYKPTEMEFKREIPRPTLPAKFRGANYRTDNPAAAKFTDLFRQDVPSAASDDRLSLTIYGGNSDTKNSVKTAGKWLADKLIGVTYIELDDHDGDPNMAKILICADGRCVKELNAPNDYDGKKLGRAIIKQAIAAYQEQIEPYLVDELPTLAAN